MSSDVTTVALDLVVLERYLLDNGIEVSGTLQARAITGGRSNLTYRVFDDHRQWVLRRPPLTGLTPSAHDVGREYRIVNALQATDVPVPQTVLSCADPAVLGAPFTLVGFVSGRTLRTQSELAALTDLELLAVQDELLTVLSRLHAVPFEELGLADFGRPAGFLQRQLSRWRAQWDRVREHELPDVDRLHGALAARVPAAGRTGIVHGDFRIDNTLLDQDDKVLALIDWEMATLGDPVTDVAMMCAYQHPGFDHVVGEPAASTSPRWPGIEAIAQGYSVRSGHELGDFDWYLGLAYLKLAVIAEGISSRYRAGAGDEPGYATSSQAVPGLLAAGLATLARGSAGVTG